MIRSRSYSFLFTLTIAFIAIFDYKFNIQNLRFISPRLENVAVVDEISCVKRRLSGVTRVIKLRRVTFTHDCFSLKS